MSNKAAQRAALLAQLAALGDDDDDADDAAEVLDAANEIVETATDAVADAQAPVVVESHAPPTPKDEAAATVRVIDAEADARIREMQAAAAIEDQRIEDAREHERSLIEDAREHEAQPLDILDSVLGPIEETLQIDDAPKAQHRWFRPLRVKG